ncbi:hypothetical protein HMPREF0201_00583 [Cedecea davisae DSM 4568]|uniref:Uncharacterized protein n=1 Tax=Cedecea davisae DSM 4568 TaxID=566551 RepID=S3J4N4_9ENTR|nr:hypothetical protein HMPREF0201_00583 [Cedecea davisae DSM 4568]
MWYCAFVQTNVYQRVQQALFALHRLIGLCCFKTVGCIFYETYC